MKACSLSICGDGSVGKSTITAAFKSDGFLPVYKQTVGCDFYEKQLNIRGDYMVSLRLWDVGGQSIRSKNLKGYISHSDAIMLVYDVTNKESFHNLDDWLHQIRSYSKPTVKIYLIANKVDLIALRQVSVAEHETYMSENNITGGLFVSAKTGENVLKCFYKIAGEAIGVKLTEYELGFHDKVLMAHVQSSSETNEVRAINHQYILTFSVLYLSHIRMKYVCICIMYIWGHSYNNRLYTHCIRFAMHGQTKSSGKIARRSCAS